MEKTYRHKEEKNKILFEALSQYLPSKLVCHISDGENVDVDRVLTGVTINGCYFDDNGALYGWNSFEIKPYLRPMSDMTEEEKKEFIKVSGYVVEESVNGRHYESFLSDYIGKSNEPTANFDAIDWLNKNKFDYRGLIPMDLAIAVTKENNL